MNVKLPYEREKRERGYIEESDERERYNMYAREIDIDRIYKLIEGECVI